MNGESSVHIDRGHWLYRFALDAGNIAIYRARRAGQSLAPAEVWRCLAVLGVSDAFVVPVQGSWQPFIELADGRHRWALEKRPTLDEPLHVGMASQIVSTNTATVTASEKRRID